MRSVILLYRILLPPIFLFRFCAPRPPETSLGHRTGDASVGLLVKYFGAQNHLRKNDYTSFQNKNEAKDVLKMNAVEFDDMNRKTWIFKRKTSGYKKRQPSLKEFTTITNSRLNFLPHEDVNNVDTSKSAFRLSTYTDLVMDVKISQRRNFDRRKFNQSGRPFDSRMKQNVLSKTKKFGDNSNHQQSMQSSKVGNNSNHQQSMQSNKVGNNSNHQQSMQSSKVGNNSNHQQSMQSSKVGNNSKHQQSMQSSKVDQALLSSKRHHHSRVTPRIRKRRGIDETAGLNPASSRGTLPEYMVHLFQLLSGTRYEALRNFVATGFVNIYKNTESQGKASRTHKLAFSVVLPHERETIYYAELRLYFFLARPRWRAQSANKSPSNDQGHKYIISVFETRRYPGLERRQIAVQTVADPDNIWLSFNVTSAVQNWPSSGVHFLEVSFNICHSCINADVQYNDSNDNYADNSPDVLVLNLDNENNKGPFMVIFSKKHESVTQSREKRDTTKRKGETIKSLNKNIQLRISETDHKNSDNLGLSNSNYFQGFIEFISTMNIDSSNYLETNDLASFTNVASLTSTVYEHNNNTKTENEQLIGQENNRTFLNAVNNLQSRVNSSSVHRPLRLRINGTNVGGINSRRTYTKKHRTLKTERHSKTAWESLAGENVKRVGVKQVAYRKAAKPRYKRELKRVLKVDEGTSGPRQKRSKKKRANCQRNEMYVDFETIKWDKVIIFPRGYQAFECAGKCYTPISEYLTPSKHAIIQTLVHTSYPEQASRACCVPTKLDPISILYLDENGDIRYDYTYDGMVVAECGCR